MILYGAGLLAVSIIVARVVPASAMSVVGNMFGEEPARAAPILILMIINIHHYFTDGVIWKISNPEVRRELFAHVKPNERGSAAASLAVTSDTVRRVPKTKAPAKAQI
jgi:hypothetical protein